MKALNTYLTFDGNTREAMSFYHKCLGGDLQIFTFGDSPVPCGSDADKSRIMHACLSNGSQILMASDTMPGMPHTAGNNFSISINCESAEETDKLFNALNEKANVTMPLQETFWAARFGMLTDQFGVNWMFNFEQPKQQ